MAKQLRDYNPLVMCITNRVTPQRVADIILSVGGSPAMVDNSDEVLEFAAISSCVYLNTGLGTSQCAVIDRILATQQLPSSIPLFVIDPVGYGATEFRTNTINKIITYLKATNHLAAIKGNAAEITALSIKLAGYTPLEQHDEVKGKGVDSDAKTESAILPAIHLAKYLKSVVSVSG